MGGEYSWAERSLPGGLTVLKRIRRCSSPVASAPSPSRCDRSPSSRRSYADLRDLLAREREVAGDACARALVLERRLLLGADLLRLRAARVEAAPARRIGRAGHVAASSALLAVAGGIGLRHRRQQRAGVGVAGELYSSRSRRSRRSCRGTSPPRGRTCGSPPTGRGRSTRASDRSRRCRSRSRFRTCAWIETSSADTGSSAISSLAAARARAPHRCAGAGRRRTRGGSGCSARDSARPSPSARCTSRFRSPLSGSSSWIANGSPMIEPTVLRGFSDEYGSWKIICTSRLIAFSAAPSERVMSLPSKPISPRVASSRRVISRAVVLLPQPVSPTMPERLSALDLEAHAVHRLHRADLALDDDPAGDREMLDEVAHPHERAVARRGLASPAPRLVTPPADSPNAERCGLDGAHVAGSRGPTRALLGGVPSRSSAHSSAHLGLEQAGDVVLGSSGSGSSAGRCARARAGRRGSGDESGSRRAD